MEQLAPAAYGYLLVLLRAASLCTVAPVLSARMVPVRVRLGIAMAMALAAHASTGFAAPLPPNSLWLLAGAAVRETAVGLFAGLAAKWAFDGAVAVGQLAGNAMGLGYGAMLDPTSGAESTVTGELLSALALGFAVTLGLHREALVWLCRSVTDTPPGAAIAFHDLAGRAVADAVRAVAMMARLGFPFLAAATAGHLALGLLGKTSPQLGINNLGFTVAICAGGGALYLLAPSAAEIIARTAVEAFK